MSEFSLGEAINSYLNKTPIKGQMHALQIIKAWEELMGKTIASYTQSLHIKRKTLYIECLAAPLKQELSYRRGKIIQVVNDWFGEEVINDVVVT
jgi:hypothetical protein